MGTDYVIKQPVTTNPNQAIADPESTHTHTVIHSRHKPERLRDKIAGERSLPSRQNAFAIAEPGTGTTASPKTGCKSLFTACMDIN